MNRQDNLFENEEPGTGNTAEGGGPVEGGV